MATTKKRISQIAKDLDKTSKEVLAVLEADLGITGKTHASTIEPDVEEKLIALLSGSKAKADAKPAEKAPAKKAEPKKAEAKSVAKPEPEKQAPKKEEPKKPEAKKPAVPAKIEPEIELEDDPVAEILKIDDSKDPLAEIEKTVERHAKQDAGVTSFKKSPETDKGEKPLVIPHKKEDHAAAVAQIEAPAKPVKEQEEEIVDRPIIQLEGPTTVGELAKLLNMRETELIKHLFMKGVMVTVNQTMQTEDAISLADELGFDALAPDSGAKIDFDAPQLQVKQAKGKHLKPRAPVVSIMGHVDHGKTSLLDAIRETRHRIVDSEAGGITQSIGAYTVEKDGEKIVFIDTPGHEAFTSMRMRGAQATDIAILVVAADDGVMPQTIEAINHAKAANIPIIVAVNKIDKADADPDKVLVQLSEHGLMAEKWGGDALTVEVSALQKLGIDDLLETITLVAELLELKADPSIAAEGVVIEARLDKGKGPIATVLVQNGTLTVGEYVLVNRVGGRVRALINDLGERVRQAGPSTPVEILGLDDVPQAGDAFIEVRNDKEFKRLLQQARAEEKEQRTMAQMAAPGLLGDKESKDFHLIIKGDTHGSVEALSASILQLATEEVAVKVIHSATGDVSEADILLASASHAVIIAFNTHVEGNAQKAADYQRIPIRHYDVIYHATEEIEKMMLGLLSPDTEEEETGTAEVRQIFSFDKTVIAGCYVTAGKILRNGTCRVFRNNKEVFKGQLNNLKRFKDDAKEVAQGYECGISFDRFNDLQPGDIIKLFTTKEIERTSL